MWLWAGQQMGKGALQAVGSILIYMAAAFVLLRYFTAKTPARADPSAGDSQLLTDAIRWRTPLLAPHT